jgi:hypothetical protein
MASLSAGEDDGSKGSGRPIYSVEATQVDLAAADDAVEQHESSSPSGNRETAGLRDLVEERRHAFAADRPVGPRCLEPAVDDGEHAEPSTTREVVGVEFPGFVDSR